jgi:AraC-like DNA-binding protein
MTYDLSSLFAEVDKRLSANPALCLFQLADELCCSYATVQKAVFKHTSLSFRAFKNTKRLEAARSLIRQRWAAKEIALQLGYNWPESFSRFLRNSTGISFKEIRKKV